MSFFSLLTIFKNKRWALLITVGVVFYLILRYFKLRQFFFLILIVAICITLEIYFRDRLPKRRHHQIRLL